MLIYLKLKKRFVFCPVFKKVRDERIRPAPKICKIDGIEIRVVIYKPCSRKNPLARLPIHICRKGVVYCIIHRKHVKGYCKNAHIPEFLRQLKVYAIVHCIIRPAHNHESYIIWTKATVLPCFYADMVGSLHI